MDQQEQFFDFNKQIFKDQVFISVIAYLGIILSGIVLCYSGVNWYLSTLITETQNEIMQEVTSNDPEFGLSFRNIQQQIMLLFIFLFGSSLFILASCVGILKRKKWARILLTFVVLFVSLATLIGVFSFINTGQDQLNQFSPNNGAMIAEMRRIAKIQSISFGLILIVLIWVIIRVIIRLNSKSVRKLFVN